MLISEFSHLKMGQISGCLSHITKSNNCLQPIFEALINSVESYLEERDREIKIIFSVQKTDSEIGNIDVQIIDNGNGFDLTDPNYPTFGRFGKWYDNSKGQNNKGCGRAQFFHYFNEVEIISKGFDANKNYKRIHWKASKEKDLYVVDDKKNDTPSTTTIYLQNYIQDKKEFYLKIADLNKLKNEIITSCFLKLLNKNIKITLKQQFIGDGENKEITITTQDFEEYKKNSQEKTIEVKYQIYKIKKDHNNKDISEFEYCDDGKSEKFKMNIYKLPTNFENHVYLCANDVAVKDILQSDNIFDKNITIEENDNKNKLLVLISDVDGCNFLNDHSNGERDNFNDIPRQQEIEQKIKSNGVATLETNYSETPILFYDDLVDNAEKKIIEVIPAIQKDNLEIQEILQIAKEYITTHNLSEKQAHKILKKSVLRHLNKDRAIQHFNEIIGYEKGKEVEENQEKISRLQNEIIESINNNNFNEEQLKEKIKQQTKLIDEANKNELAGYILRRKYIIERLKKVFNSPDEKLKEQELHNLFATKRNSVDPNQYDKTNLWLLDDKFMVFDKLFSDQELDKITEELFKNDTTFSKNLNTDKPEENTEEKKLERAKKRRPDIVLFKDINNNLRKIVLIEFKKPDADDYDYNKGLYQLNCYANYIAKQQKVAAEYFGFLLVNSKLEIGDEFVTNSLKGEYKEIYNLSDGCRSFAKAKDLYDDKEKTIGYLNIQVIPSNVIINDAEARNFVFDKIMSKTSKPTNS